MHKYDPDLIKPIGSNQERLEYDNYSDLYFLIPGYGRFKPPRPVPTPGGW